MGSEDPQRYLNISLVTAARRGNVRVMKQMLRKGADVNGESDDETSLCQAASNGHAECVDFLLKAGADVNILSYKNKTTLMAAAEGGNVRCVELLLQAGAGADVNIRDKYEETALMYAARKGNWECLNTLLNAGADVNMLRRGNVTILMTAAESGNARCVELLLQTGSYGNQRDAFGNTALMLAARKGNWECIKTLLNAGADVNMRGREYGSKTVIDALLYHAVTPNKIKTLKILLAAGAKINRVWLNIDCVTENERLQIKHLLLVAGETKFHVEQQLLDATTPRKVKTLTFWCRDIIWQYLKNLDKHENLFVRIRKLGLPKLLQKILLFNWSLDIDDDDKD